jgi:hypothetical protein
LARENLIEALKLFLITCFEKGTLDIVLKECGFKPTKTPVKFPKDHRFIKVPILFTVKGQPVVEICI